MFHIPAHKNVTNPGAQVAEPHPQASGPRAIRHEVYYCGTKVREREVCTCGAVRHWECNAGCRAEHKAPRIPPASESLYLPLRAASDK